MAQKKKPATQAPSETTSVRISEPLRVRAKVYASANRASLQSVIDAAVDEFLRKRGA